MFLCILIDIFIAEGKHHYIVVTFKREDLFCTIKMMFLILWTYFQINVLSFFTLLKKKKKIWNLGQNYKLRNNAFIIVLHLTVVIWSSITCIIIAYSSRWACILQVSDTVKLYAICFIYLRYVAIRKTIKYRYIMYMYSKFSSTSRQCAAD